MSSNFRKLSERPSASELKERNILKDEQAESQSKRNMEETRIVLLRKASLQSVICKFIAFITSAQLPTDCTAT